MTANTAAKALFQPIKIGPYTLKHRLALAPLTRMRAEPSTLSVWELNAEYYRQRTTDGGLLICEASQVMQEGQGSPNTPGCYTPEQIEGWKIVTKAIHDKGGIAFLQLWHVGRASHSSFQPGGALPVSASPIAIKGKTRTADGKVAEFETPRALETSDIPRVVDAYRQGALNAIAAGFDGVEIHGANGYLIEQFMQSNSNKRTDAYGGSIENRCRLLKEVTEAVIGAIGAERTGVRLSPYGISNDSGEADPMPLYTYAIKMLADLKIAYLHFVEPRSSGSGRAEVDHKDVPSAYDLFRPIWPGVLVTAGGFTAESAEAAVASGNADVIAFGRYFISTPDLPDRIRNGVPFTPYNRATFYGGDAVGYTDYPVHQTGVA